MNQQITPLVSVIVAFLNEERFLSETVNSVINQNYTNWELILIDDGSTDGSSVIAKEYADKHPGKIKYTNHKNHMNKGVSASRNYAVSLSSGEFIAILDADDVWLPEKLQLQINILQQHPDVAMICEASKYWYSWSDKAEEDIIIYVGKEQDKVFQPPSLLEVLYPLSEGAAPCPSAILVSKEAYIKQGGFEEHFRGKYQLYEDQTFLIKFYLHEIVFISSFCNNLYRQREGSCVQRVNAEGNYHIVREYFLKWLKKYLAENEIQTTKVLDLVKSALKPYRSKLLISRVFRKMFF